MGVFTAGNQGQPAPLPPDIAQALDSLVQQGGARRLGTRVLYYPSTTSTNDLAARLAADESSEGIVVLADHQTAGRGRRGRTWFSPPGSGLYVSVILSPGRARATPERATALLTLAAGVALAEAVEWATGLAPSLKWPNDLLIGRRKLAGILAEASSPAGTAWPPHVIVGYGINVAPMAYPRELELVATSLETELGKAVDRAALLAASIDRLDRRYAALLDGRFDAILDDWRQRAPSHRGARVRFVTSSGYQTGVTDGIDEWGALVVRTPSGVERVVAGEVDWE